MHEADLDVDQANAPDPADALLDRLAKILKVKRDCFGSRGADGGALAQGPVRLLSSDMEAALMRMQDDNVRSRFRELLDELER